MPAGCGRKYPGLEIASKETDTWNDKVYVYVKADAEEEESKGAAAKTALMNSQAGLLYRGQAGGGTRSTRL